MKASATIGVMLALSISVGSTNAQRVMERLDRGVVALEIGRSTFISWRLLAADPDAIRFHVYRQEGTGRHNG